VGILEFVGDKLILGRDPGLLRRGAPNRRARSSAAAEKSLDSCGVPATKPTLRSEARARRYIHKNFEATDCLRGLFAIVRLEDWLNDVKRSSCSAPSLGEIFRHQT